MLPFAVFLLSFSIDIDTFAMLLSLIPVSDIFAAIRPLEGAFALLHVIDVLADIATAIRPREGSVSFHLIIAPLPVEDAPVGPFIDALSVDVVLDEGASVS